MKGCEMEGKNFIAVDQAAPISTDDLRTLLDAATPGPWNVTAPVEGSPEFRMIQHGPYGISECGKYLSVSGGVSEEDARLIALAPHLAAEVLVSRADLAAPSAQPRLETAVREAINLLMERNYGSPARSPGHNARRLLEAALTSQQPAAPSAPAEVDDGRPMNTDVFLGKLFEACECHWERCEAINEWLHGDWPAALEYLEGEA